MRIAKLGIAIAVAACSELNSSDPPSWVGTYAYLADSARNCVETGSTYNCSCGPTGYYEGTLTLGGSESAPTGQLEVQACSPGAPGCSSPFTLPVVPFFALPAEAGFCVGTCGLSFANDGGWSHQIDTIEPDSIVGVYRRADGSPRGCGLDFGPFKATRE
jgi:hypothetical protein